MTKTDILNVNSAKLLLIEDEKTTQLLVSAALSQFDLKKAESLQEGRILLAQFDFDLILLDVGLPDGDGFQFLMELQGEEKTRLIPVVMLTAKTEDSDKVTAYSLGADDYFTKPINPIVLRAAIQAKLERRENRAQQQLRIRVGDLSIDMVKQEVEIYQKEIKQLIDLTPHEYKLMVLFAKHEDQVFTRDQLIDRVWGDGVFVNDRTVDSHISRLRKLIRSSGLTIKSIYGLGYKLTTQDSHS